MLKLSFPVNVNNNYASYDIPYGSIRRPVQGTEESGQMWFDVCDGDYGLAILNNGKYSFDVLDNDMRMTIANSSMYADHYAGDHRDGLCEFLDQGIQRFTYSLYPHKGDWDANVVKAAYELNTEETHINETYHEGKLPRTYQGISISTNNVILTAFKHSYERDGYIIRLCEYEGKDTSCDISLPSLDRTFTVDIPKYAIRTFHIPLEKNKAISECDIVEKQIRS